MLELLYPRGELARLVRELELALVELPCAGGDELLALRALGGNLDLALFEDFLACLQLHACLRRLLFGFHEPVLALRQLLLQ